VANVLLQKNRKPLIDYEDGISRIGCSVEIFDKILGQYYNETLGITDAVTEAIDSEDFIRASEIVHKLKSSSGNIGAKELYQVASELNTALKLNDRPLIQKTLPDFLEQVNLIQSELKRHLRLST
jgi:HPt (histidine-containing phosphotransfer) domain-containing protein